MLFQSFEIHRHRLLSYKITQIELILTEIYVFSYLTSRQATTPSKILLPCVTEVAVF
jgi:hypothetical protein